MKKKLLIVSIIVIIIAAFVVAAVGYNVELRYKNHVSIVVPIGEKISLDEMKKITNEVFSKKEVAMEKSGLYDDEVVIRVAEVSDEQIELLKNKVNEKFNVKQNVLVPISDEEYNLDDVKAAAKEAWGLDEVNVEKSKESAKYASIEAGLLTKKDLESLNAKVNEKFNLTNEITSIGATNVITTTNVPRFRLLDMAKQYIIFTAIATVAVIIYFVAVYSKLGVKDILQDSLTILVFSELLYMAIIALTRAPISKIVILGAYAIYFAIITYLCNKYSKKLADSKK